MTIDWVARQGDSAPHSSGEKLYFFKKVYDEFTDDSAPQLIAVEKETGVTHTPDFEASPKLYVEKAIESGFRYDTGIGRTDLFSLRMKGTRPLRKISQIRVNPIEMDIEQLNHALNKKMIEKMGRKVPVSLVDKQHAKCGICNAVVSLNKKFEIVHLVRHFNAWHPSAHRCAGNWQNRPDQAGCGKPLSIQDFAVIDVSLAAPGNLQCIWCGMFMDRNVLAMHFTEVHPDEIEVPQCLLCVQELVINARLLEKYGEDFEVTLPDEHHVKCMKFRQTFSSELALDKAIAKRMQKINVAINSGVEEDDDEDEEEHGGYQFQTVTNSRMTLGRRNKPKRSFVKPSLRQAVPTNSKYVEAVTECQWKCKLCQGNIFGAVISAGAIKHYKEYHPGEVENMQYELCKARLDRVSGGCMEFVHPQLVECLVCNLTYTLHKPYNICRGIRHLKLKHPSMMPENSEGAERTIINKAVANVSTGEITDVYSEEDGYEELAEDNELAEIEATEVKSSTNKSGRIVASGGGISDAVIEKKVKELMDVATQGKEQKQVLAHEEFLETANYQDEESEGEGYYEYAQVNYIDHIAEGQYIDAEYIEVEGEGEGYYEYAQVDYIDGSAEGQYIDAEYIEVEGEVYHEEVPQQQ